MHRRTFLITATAVTALPTLGSAYPSQAFTPAIWNDLSETDRTVILNYRAAWSLTCQIKADLIAQALEDTPEYRDLTFIDVDWDTFGRSQLTERLKVTRRSTLLVVKSGKEVTRLVNEPYDRRVRALLDAALAA